MDLTDQSLVSRVLEDNDLRAYDSLMKRHQEGVFRMAMMYAGNREAAFDIVQDAFLKAYQNLSTFRGDSAFKTWLYKIVYYESLNWLRKRKRKQRESDVTDHEYHLESEDRSDDLALRGERHQMLYESMKTLNEKYQTVVYLKYFDNLPLKEIAKIVDTTEGTIKNILFRSLRKLHDVLKPEMEGIK